MIDKSGQDELAAMTIGAFANASRLSVKALRLYEQHGLLAPDHVDEATAYRYYMPSQLEPARLISRLREVAMPLSVVADVLAAEDEAEADRRIAFWWGGQERVAQIRRKLVQSLRASVSPDNGEVDRPYAHTVAYRDTPEMLLMTEQSHVSIDQLPTFIADVIARLASLVNSRSEAVQHPAIVIYHGRVDEDGDGPVEVGLEIDPLTPVDLPTGVKMHRQAAGREAFITLTKAQLVYPDILAAYDELESRLATDGRVPIAPPREYYFTDIFAARPDDAVCHAAIPVA